jgi:hypothetical protein
VPEDNLALGFTLYRAAGVASEVYVRVIDNLKTEIAEGRLLAPQLVLEHLSDDPSNVSPIYRSSSCDLDF